MSNVVDDVVDDVVERDDVYALVCTEKERERCSDELVVSSVLAGWFQGVTRTSIRRQRRE